MKYQKTRHGEMIFPEHDLFIGKSLTYYGEAQYYETEFLLQLVKSDSEDVFVDIGAGIGNIAIPMAKKIGSGGYVLALEAHSFLYHTMCGNIALNHLGNVQAFQRAASDVSNAHCYFAELDPRSELDFREITLSTLLNSEDEYKRKREQPVASLCLDDLRLRAPNVIKIDVNGFEMQSLRGMKGTIERASPILYIRAKSPNEDMMKFLSAVNYDWEIHSPPIYNKTNFFYKLEDIFQDRENPVYMFCYLNGKRPDIEDQFFMSSEDQRFAPFEAMKEKICGSPV